MDSQISAESTANGYWSEAAYADVSSVTVYLVSFGFVGADGGAGHRAFLARLKAAYRCLSDDRTLAAVESAEDIDAFCLRLWRDAGYVGQLDYLFVADPARAEARLHGALTDKPLLLAMAARMETVPFAPPADGGHA